MKKINFVLLSLLLLTGCGTSKATTNPTSTTTSEKESELSYSFELKNVIDGKVKNANFYFENEKIEPTFENDKFSLNFEATKLPGYLRIENDKYETKSILLSEDTDLETISLEYKFKQFASSKYNSSFFNSEFTASSTRGLEYLRLKFSSPKTFFESSTNELFVYINTSKPSSKLKSGDYLFKLKANDFYVYDFGFVHDYVDKSLFNYEIVTSDSTDIYLDIPYSFLKIQSSSVIGINYYENIVDQDIIVPMMFDDEIIDVDNTTKYERLNIRGDFFANNVNEDNPSWISKAKKKELIVGKDYSFASPLYNAHEEADDVYFSLDYNVNSLDLSFVGFGQFEDSEYFKLIVHNNILDKNSWNLTADDMIFHIYKDHVDLFTGVTYFFDIEQRGIEPFDQFDFDTYVDNVNHFTMSVSIPLELINNIKSTYDDIYIMMVEFGEGILYEGKNFYENFFYKGVSQGDPADMVSYKCIDAPMKRVCHLSDEEKNDLIGDRNISFADPKEVLIDKADDFYMDITRTDTGLSFDIIGFGDFSETEIVTFTFHMSEVDGKDWVIQKSDVSLMMSRDMSMLVTGTTDYWVSTRITRGQKYTKTQPQYVRYDEYFTIQLELTYSELGKEITRDSNISMYALEFGFGGIIYNSDPWTKAMKKDGVPCGDPAFQQYYLDI